MTALDIFVILLLGGAALVGFVRGFTHEVLEPRGSGGNF